MERRGLEVDSINASDSIRSICLGSPVTGSYPLFSSTSRFHPGSSLTTVMTLACFFARPYSGAIMPCVQYLGGGVYEAVLAVRNARIDHELGDARWRHAAFAAASVDYFFQGSDTGDMETGVERSLQ